MTLKGISTLHFELAEDSDNLTALFWYRKTYPGAVKDHNPANFGTQACRLDNFNVLCRM